MSEAVPPFDGEIRDLSRGHFQIWKDNGWHDLTGKDHTIRTLEKRVEELKDKIETQEIKWQKGVCPKCGVSMFDKFSASIHDVDNCGNKKAVAPSTEFA